MSDPRPGHAALAGDAARAWGLPEPALLRTGMNSLFAAGDEVVLRVGPLPFGVAAEVSWFATLARLDVRTPRCVRDPYEVDGVGVTALERVEPAGEVDWREVGAMIRIVHGIDRADVPGLPSCTLFPHWQIEDVLADLRDDIDDAARRGIDACLTRWDGWRARARENPVVCHGDVHPGNVLPTRDGPVLLDWDLRCLGPVAWDHGPLMAWGDRWDGTPDMYDAFADGYGRSLRGEWMGESMADLRNLVATLMRVRAARTDAAAAAEAAVRLRYWRGEPDAPRWTPQ